jgi:hypothetical protein
MTTKKDAWDRKSKFEQYAAIVYGSSDEETRKAMLARQGGAKALEGPNLLDHSTRGSTSPLGGTAQPLKKG